MSESDYQRGLRGGDSRITDYGSDAYRDWSDGQKDYEINNGTYSERFGPLPASYIKECKEREYKEADNVLFTGIWISLGLLVVIPIAGYIIQGFLDFFKFHIPSVVIWIITILLIIFTIWGINTDYKEKKEKAYRKYGDRD